MFKEIDMKTAVNEVLNGNHTVLFIDLKSRTEPYIEYLEVLTLSEIVDRQNEGRFIMDSSEGSKEE